MRKRIFLPALVFFAMAANAQYPSGRTCAPFDSTFHFLKPRNLNLWVEAGILSSGRSSNLHIYNSVVFDMHYVPVKYLQIGGSLHKRLPSEEDVSYWKSYDLALYAKYTFLRMDCPKMGVFASAGYTNAVSVKKNNGGKENDWMPQTGIGIYKDLGKSFMVQFEGNSYYNERPPQMSLHLVWKFMNMRVR